MDQFPQKSGLKHDKDFGKIKIVNKYLSKRYSQKLIRVMGLMLETEEANRPDFISLENVLVN